MGWSFRKSIKLGFVRVNLSKSGIGGSVGVKGYRKGIDAKGRQYSHVSIPGTGIYNRTYDSRNLNLDTDLNPNEYKKLNTTGYLTVSILILMFGFLWFGGESFWFAAVITIPAALFTGIFTNSKLYDTYMRGDEQYNQQDSETLRLEQELAQLESEEQHQNTSPFAVFDLDSECTRKELDRAFKSKIKLYHPDKLEHLGPELQDLGKQKSKEIIEAYEKCAQILQQKRSA